MSKYFKMKHLILLVLGFLLLVDTANNLAFADIVFIAPARPENLEAIEVTGTKIVLSWNKSRSEVSRYKVYKDSTYVGSSTETTYTVENLEPNKEYEFYVRSESGKNNVSLASEKLLVKTQEVISNRIIGYYPAWKSYSGFTPDKIDAQKLTHINYAFAYIGEGNKIKLGYPDKDKDNFNKLNELKKENPNLKILISVGGWNWSGKFSDTASTKAARAEFAKSCVEFLIEHSIDGVDLDWEYPVGGGLPGNNKSPQDKENFTHLLKEIREKLNEQQLKDGKSYLLTIAGGASNYYLKNIEPAKISEYLDFVNIMTYDLHGPWDEFTDFNSPLYNKKSPSPQYDISVNSSVNAWLNAGFTGDKLVVGIPFYGYMYSASGNNDGLLQSFAQGKALSYSSIKTNYMNKSGYKRYFHSDARVPWLYDGNTFISYEDEESIRMKAEYISDEKLGGAMVWELSQDYNNELLNVIYEGLK